MDVERLTGRAKEIADLYDVFNLQTRNRTWTRTDTALGFVGDVGDLAKLVMGAEGTRSFPGGKDALEHELADCLWSVLVLAHEYEVDLESAFLRTMDQLERDIRSQL